MFVCVCGSKMFLLCCVYVFRVVFVLYCAWVGLSVKCVCTCIHVLGKGVCGHVCVCAYMHAAVVHLHLFIWTCTEPIFAHLHLFILTCTEPVFAYLCTRLQVTIITWTWASRCWTTWRLMPVSLVASQPSRTSRPVPTKTSKFVLGCLVECSDLGSHTLFNTLFYAGVYHKYNYYVR